MFLFYTKFKEPQQKSVWLDEILTALSISLRYIFTQPLCHEQDVTQSQFLNTIKLVRIFLLLDWLPNQHKKNSVCSTPNP